MLDKAQREQVAEISIHVAVRLGLLLLVLLLTYTVIAPFMVILIWGVILAVTLYPIYEWLKPKLFGRGSIAATVIVFIGLAVTLIPASLLGAASIDGLRALESGVADGTITIPPPPASIADWPFIGTELASFWWLAATNLQDALLEVKPQTQALGRFLLEASAGAGVAVLQFAVSIIVAGLLFGPAEVLRSTLQKFAARVLSTRATHFIDLSQKTIQNVAQGVIGVALLQAILASVGYLATDYPFGGAITLVVLVMSILNLGATTPILLSIIYGWTIMDTVPALLFTLYMVPVGLLDNFLRPIIVARGLPVPTAVMFVGVIGGALAGGLLGLFIGPIVLAVAYNLFSAWISGEDGASVPDSKEKDQAGPSKR